MGHFEGNGLDLDKHDLVCMGNPVAHKKNKWVFDSTLGANDNILHDSQKDCIHAKWTFV